MDLRTSYSMLRAVEVPASGGPTCFADGRSAYDDLPQDVKDKIEDLECEHSLSVVAQAGRGRYHARADEERHRPVHKLVHVHKGSGRKTIYAGAHCYKVVGWGWEEKSRTHRLSSMTHATQDTYTIKVDYAVGDMVIWDNLAVFLSRRRLRVERAPRHASRHRARGSGARRYDDDPFGELFKDATDRRPGLIDKPMLITVEAPATDWAAASNRGGPLFQEDRRSPRHGRLLVASVSAGAAGLMQAASAAAAPAQASSVALEPNPSQ